MHSPWWSLNFSHTVFPMFVKHIKLPHLGYISLGLHFAYTPPPDFYVAVSFSSVTSSFNFISERFLGAPTPSKLAIHCSRHSYLLITKFFFFGNRTFTFTKHFRTKSSRETGPFPMPRHDSVILKHKPIKQFKGSSGWGQGIVLLENCISLKKKKEECSLYYHRISNIWDTLSYFEILRISRQKWLANVLKMAKKKAFL